MVYFHAFLALVLVACCVSNESTEAAGREDGLVKRQTSMEDGCPPWGPWRESQCWWPNLPIEAYPCQGLHPNLNVYPQWLARYFNGKFFNQWHAIMRSEWIERGRPVRCGQCSVRWSCHERQMKTGQTLPDHCKFMQDHPVAEPPCPGDRPCQLEPVGGSCSPPGFLSSDNSVLSRWFSSGTPFNYKHHGHKEKLLEELNELVEGLTGPAREAARTNAWRVGNLLQTLNQTNCARDPTNGKCLCCCAPFVPNVTSRQCIDVSVLLERQLDVYVRRIQATVASSDSSFDIGALFQQIVDSLGQMGNSNN